MKQSVLKLVKVLHFLKAKSYGKKYNLNLIYFIGFRFQLSSRDFITMSSNIEQSKKQTYKTCSKRFL